MENQIGINFDRLGMTVDELQQHIQRYTPATLNNTAPNCVIAVNTNANNTFNANQEIIGLVGDDLRVESLKLGLIKSSFMGLENDMFGPTLPPFGH